MTACWQLLSSCRDKHRPNPYKHIDESVSASRPDLMITDFMTFGAWDVAEKHKVR
jgi:hypothetical protein